MRTLLCLLICVVGCAAQRPEDQILAVYKQMEKAEQTGDANLFVSLFARESIENAEKIRPIFRGRPDAHYTVGKIFVQSDQAVLVGQIDKEQYLSMRLVKEDGRWKIKDQLWNEKPFHPDSVYAAIPLPPGAFERAGSPWQNVAAAVTKDFQVRATYDESYLYIRIEAPIPFPPPGATAETPPHGWTVMKAAVSGVGEFVLYPSADIGDQATFDANGRTNSHRPFVTYSIRLERGGKQIFRASADLHPDPLIRVGEHSLEVRVPMRTLGVVDAKRTKITLGDAQWPKPAVFSLDVPLYR